MTYSEQLDALYKEDVEVLSSGCPPESKLEFLGDTVFDFTTYDKAMSAAMASQMLEVIECIALHKQFEYQKDHYVNYLMMVNMPFMQGKLEWGTSIRGAWFDYSKEFNVYGMIIKAYGYDRYESHYIDLFMLELVAWSKS